MVHNPAAGQPVRRIETYLLPEGAELVSTKPESIKISKESGRIKISHEEIVPAGGNILTEFVYRLATGEPNNADAKAGLEKAKAAQK
jgi:hypothetical protein